MMKLPLIGLTGIKLKEGAHKTREDGVCAMEAVAWLAGEPHSDAPVCACPALSRYVLWLNDRFTQKERQKLKKFLSRIVGTRDGRSLERARLLAYAAGTVFAPIALELKGLTDHAQALRETPPGDLKELRKRALAARVAVYEKYGYDATYAAAAATTYATYAADAAATYAAAAAADAAATYAAAAAAATYATYAADAATYAMTTAAAAARKQVVKAALKALDEAIKIGEAERTAAQNNPNQTEAQ
jgi:hypothetical protein